MAADSRTYRINKKLSPYSHLKLILNTDAGLVETNDEWYDDPFFEEIMKMMPKGVGADQDMPGWNDKPELNVVYHGWDEAYKELGTEDEEIEDLAFVVVYFDVKNGIVTKVLTESAGL